MLSCGSPAGIAMLNMALVLRQVLFDAYMASICPIGVMGMKILSVK